MREPKLERIAARLSGRAESPHAIVSPEGSVDVGAGTVHRFRLGNGLRVSLLVDRSAPVVAYQTWFRVGSRHEREGKTGLAHLLEHLMFHETRTLAHAEFDRLLEAAGGESNAATWTDWTYYHDAVPRRHLALVVRLEADRMANLVLDPARVAMEKEVVLNERRYRVDDDVEGFANERLWASAFRSHPYRWPTIGWMKDIEGFTAADCAAFYAAHYAPNNADVVIVGDFEPARALALVQAHYGAIPPAPPVPEVAPVEPLPRRERRVTLRGETPTEKLALGYRAPPFDHPDHPVLTVVNELLFGGRSARLHRALVVDREIASEARGSLSPFAHGGLFEVWLSMRPGREAREALEVLDPAVASLAAEPVDPAELDRARNRLELQFLTAMETASGRAEQVGFYQALLGDAGRIPERVAALRAVTQADVARAARRWLVPRLRTAVHVVPAARAAADGRARRRRAARAAR